MKNRSFVWHPNTQMSEWNNFPKIVKGDGMWLEDSKGNRYLDGVASMWCNVWGHSKKELINSLVRQSKNLQHSSLFNLSNQPAENLARELVKMSPRMHMVYYSDNGSTSIEIALKLAIQYWQNIGYKNRVKIASLENGYHGDTIGAMSVGYIPKFFSKFKNQLFPSCQLPVPNKYRLPKKFSLSEYTDYCLEKIEKTLANDDKIAAFVMESGAQMAGGVIIYPERFQQKISNLCKKFEIPLILDEIATGFGRLGSMVEYKAQKSQPDIVAFGKMLTGGYLTMAATLVTKKIYDSFLGHFNEFKHIFHGHTFTGNPLASTLAYENLRLYRKYKLIERIKKTSKIFENRSSEIKELDLVGDVRYKGMVMGIELVKNKEKKEPINPKISVNKIIFEAGKKNGIYLRTLGNIVMLVPPLAISSAELDLAVEKTISTINSARKMLENG